MSSNTGEASDSGLSNASGGWADQEFQPPRRIFPFETNLMSQCYFNDVDTAAKSLGEEDAATAAGRNHRSNGSSSWPADGVKAAASSRPATAALVAREDSSTSIATQLLTTWQALQIRLLSWWAFKHWRVKLLVHALSAMNAPVNLLAVPCDKLSPHQAGYSPTQHTIWMCANCVWNPVTFRKALTHELIHAFDDTRAHLDATNCHHIACTEIRASNLSMQCGFLATLSTHPADFYTSHHLPMNSKRDKCVAHRAILSLRDHPSCKTPGVAENAVTNVFQRCIRDHWPFIASPEQDSAWRPSKIIHTDSFDSHYHKT